jgi:hypothetical protein
MKGFIFVCLLAVALSMPSDIDEAPFADFIKGFLEGINEKGDIEALMKCVKEGEDIMKKIIEALKLIKTLDPLKVLKGVKELVDAIKHLMNILQPCMEGFEQLKKLMNAISHVSIPKIVKKIISHPGEFIKHITQCIEGFTKKDYHLFGKALGQLCAMLFLQTEQDTADMLVEFMKGFLEGLNEKGDIEKLMSCIKGGESIIKKLIEGFKLIKTMNPIKVMEGVKKVVEAIKELMSMLKPCMEGFEELKKLLAALGHINITKIVKNIIAHPGEIIKIITEAIEGFAKKDFHLVGKACGQFCKTVFLSRMDAAELLLDFFKGMFEAIKEKGDLAKMVPCAKGGNETLAKINDALVLIKSFKHKDVKDGCDKLLPAFKELAKLVQPCIANFETLKKLEDAVRKLPKNKLIHKIVLKKADLDKPVGNAIEEFKKGNWAGFGKNLGEFCVIIFLNDL